MLLTATFALLITISSHPLLVAAFRPRVTVSMNAAAPAVDLEAGSRETLSVSPLSGGRAAADIAMA